MNDVDVIDPLVQKRTEGIQTYRFRLTDGSSLLVPNNKYKYQVSIANSESLIKTVDMNINDSQLSFSSEQVRDLQAGSYRLEIWEMVDDAIHAIFPANRDLRFIVQTNTRDLPNGTVSSLTLDEFEKRFSDLAKRISTGTFEDPKFTVGETKTVASDQPASVEMVTNDDGTVQLSFSIPKGKDGEAWEPYINEDGNWHIRLKQGDDNNGIEN